MTIISRFLPALRQISCQGPEAKAVPKPYAWYLDETAAVDFRTLYG